MTPKHCWHVDRGGARLQLDRFSANVDVAHPAAGLGNVLVDGHWLAGINLLGVDLPGEPPSSASNVEHYVRGTDLIATYGETPQRPLRAQIYWRVAADKPRDAIAGVELLASVQTSLLDACPQLTTRSVVTAGEVWRLIDERRGEFASVATLNDAPTEAGDADPPCCFVFRLASTQFSYVEMVAPNEAPATQLDRAGAGDGSSFRVQLAHRLFAERLEKGVILRARVLGVLVDRDGDLSAGARLYADFMSAAPPLTT